MSPKKSHFQPNNILVLLILMIILCPVIGCGGGGGNAMSDLKLNDLCFSRWCGWWDWWPWGGNTGSDQKPLIDTLKTDKEKLEKANDEQKLWIVVLIISCSALVILAFVVFLAGIALGTRVKSEAKKQNEENKKVKNQNRYPLDSSSN